MLCVVYNCFIYHALGAKPLLFSTIRQFPTVLLWAVPPFSSLSLFLSFLQLIFTFSSHYHHSYRPLLLMHSFSRLKIHLSTNPSHHIASSIGLPSRTGLLNGFVLVFSVIFSSFGTCVRTGYLSVFNHMLKIIDRLIDWLIDWLVD